MHYLRFPCTAARIALISFLVKPLLRTDDFRFDDGRQLSPWTDDFRFELVAVADGLRPVMTNESSSRQEEGSDSARSNASADGADDGPAAGSTE